MRKIIATTNRLLAGVFLLMFLPQTVYAGGDLCSIFGPLCDAMGIGPGDNGLTGETAFNYTAARINIVISLIFVLIITVAVFIIVKAGVKYIQSQGNAEMIGEAQNAMRNVFIGIAMLFIGIVGIILVLAFFGGTQLLESGVSLRDIFNL